MVPLGLGEFFGNGRGRAPGRVALLQVGREQFLCFTEQIVLVELISPSSHGEFAPFMKIFRAG